MIASFFEINGIKIYRFFLEDALKKVLQPEPQKLFFVNAHTIMIAKTELRCLQALQRAEILLNDGLGIDMASFLCTGAFFPDNMNGTDFIPLLLRRSQGRKVFFLGTKDATLQKLREKFKQQFPQHTCVGTFQGYFSNPHEPLEAIRKVRPDLLIVGTGTPRQEEFIDAYWEELKESGVRLAIGGGGIIDFMSGTIPRAPRWMRKMRMEWVYRLYQEPKRLFYRYVIEGMQFVWYILGQMWSTRRGR